MPTKLERKTKNLVVRPLRAGDFDAWKIAWSTMHGKQNEWDTVIRAPKDLTRAQFRKVLSTHRRWQKNDQFFDFGIFNRKTGELLGFVALMDITRKLFQNAYLGYRMFNLHWGKGYAFEAVEAAIDIAFRDLKLHRLEAGIAPKNRRSLQLAKRLHLRREGRCPRRLFIGGAWQDMLIFAITSEEVGVRWKPPVKMAPRIQ